MPMLLARILFLPALALFAWSFGAAVTAFSDQAGRFGVVNLYASDWKYIWMAAIGAVALSALMIFSLDVSMDTSTHNRSLLSRALHKVLAWVNGVGYVVVIGYMGMMAIIMLVVIFASPMLGLMILVPYLIALAPVGYIALG